MLVDLEVQVDLSALSESAKLCHSPCPGLTPN